MSLLTICFFISGVAGLIYEVVWSRQLALFVGMTSHAHAAVITSYLLGLSLGGLVVGRFARPARAIRLFAVFELAIGMYALMTPEIMNAIQLMYARYESSLGWTGWGVQAFRFLTVLVILLPATFLMGGTLPLMVCALSMQGSLGMRSTSRVYGVNTLGAVAGTLMAGYVLIPAIGMRNTLHFAAAIDAAVALVVLVLFRKGAIQHIETVTRTSRHSSRMTRRHGWMALLYGLSGCSALAYQVAWIRSITLVIGSSVYSFSTILAVYLAGIGLGSLLHHRSGTAEPERLAARAAWLSAGTGFAAIAGLHVIQALPSLFMWGYEKGWIQHFGFFQIYALGLSALVVIIPTMLLGMLFPVVVSWWIRSPEGTGRGVGAVYAANTVGCIAGVLLAGFLALPRMGVHGTVMTAAFLHAAVALGFLRLNALSFFTKRNVTAIVTAGLLFGAAAFTAPGWDRLVMTSGVYQYAPGIAASDTPGLDAYAADSRLVFYKDGTDATVSVVENDYQRSLVIQGKYDASSRGDMPTQLMSGHLPALMHPAPRRALVIGLGSGVTAAAIAAHPSVEHIDILEISPEVVEASRFFREQNRDVLDDPRVRLIMADARNFILGCRDSYDVIISQPSNPWLSGNANLFTVEFMRLLSQRLNPGGVVCQWFHLYHMAEDDVRSIGRGFIEQHPHASLWMSLSSDLLFIGSDRPAVIDLDRFERLAGSPTIKADLALSGRGDALLLAKMFLMGGEALANFCQGAWLNTDDRPRVEFDAPRNLFTSDEAGILARIIDLARQYPSPVPFKNGVILRNDQLILSGIPVRINVPATLKAEDWQAGYYTDRALVRVGETGRQWLVNGSEFQIQWQDREESNVFTISCMDNARSNDELRRYLASNGNLPEMYSGFVDLPGGRTAAWNVCRDQSNQDIQVLNLAWSMPSSMDDGGFFECVVSRSLPPFPPDQIGAQLFALANILLFDY